MNKYNVTFTKNDETLSKKIEAQDEGTAIAVMLRDEKVSEGGIIKIELLEDSEGTKTEYIGITKEENPSENLGVVNPDEAKTGQETVEEKDKNSTENNNVSQEVVLDENKDVDTITNLDETLTNENELSTETTTQTEGEGEKVETATEGTNETKTEEAIS